MNVWSYPWWILWKPMLIYFNPFGFHGVSHSLLTLTLLSFYQYRNNVIWCGLRSNRHILTLSLIPNQIKTVTYFDKIFMNWIEINGSLWWIFLDKTKSLKSSFCTCLYSFIELKTIKTWQFWFWTHSTFFFESFRSLNVVKKKI